jgi:hypothetical protein
MSATFISLLAVEAILTAAAVLMFVYRGVLDLKEEDHLILDEAESHLARDQASIRYKATVLGKYLKFVSIAWFVLGVVIFGVWVAQGLALI